MKLPGISPTSNYPKKTLSSSRRLKYSPTGTSRITRQVTEKEEMKKLDTETIRKVGHHQVHLLEWACTSMIMDSYFYINILGDKLFLNRILNHWKLAFPANHFTIKAKHEIQVKIFLSFCPV